MQPAMLTNEESIIAAQRQDTRIHCPWCAHTRRKAHEKTCSVTIEPNRTLYDCHHCGENGVVFHDRIGAEFRPQPQFEQKVTRIPTPLAENAELVTEFFRARGIDLSKATKLPAVVGGMKFFPQAGREVPAVGFVYGHKDAPTAIKWRATERKAFTQDGAAREFYGLDLLPEGAKEIIIVEGEADAVALASIGIVAISVPNGAPMKLSKGRVSPEEDTKFSYLWAAQEALGATKRIVLAVDQDEPGNALAEEIARRVGRAKCWRPTYPEGCKDVGDVLRDYGADAVRELLEHAEAMPLSGVYAAKDYSGPLYEVYRKGLSKGLSTGYASVDDLYTVSEGRLTIVTGHPGSGKSEFIDQIMINLAKNHDLKFAIASFENPPHIHIAKLAEKIIEKPFHEGVTPRMRQEELTAALDFIDGHFTFLESRDGHLPTIESIIDRAKQAVMRLGVRGLVVDPYNYISKPRDTPEYEWISQMLTEMSHFAKAYDLHIWFVAHPTKQQRRDDGSYGVPKGHEISGSAAWFSKADFGLTVHRGGQGVEFHCWKARFKWEGAVGMCLLDYDIPTGRYFEHLGFPAINSSAPARQHWQDNNGWGDF